MSGTIGTTIGQALANELALPSINDLAGGVVRVYEDTDKNIKLTGEFVGDVKNRSFDNLGFGITLAFIFGGTIVLLYGPVIFEGFKALSDRIAKYGVQIHI